MKLDILFTRAAVDDLQSIQNFIAAANPENARRFIESLREKCLLLAENPSMGRAREELLPGLRSFPVGRYLIFYSMQDRLVIERVLAGSQALEKHFDL